MTVAQSDNSIRYIITYSPLDCPENDSQLQYHLKVLGIGCLVDLRD